MRAYQSFTEHMLARAAEIPDRPALVLLAEDAGQTAEMLTYGTLDRAAKELAGWLQERGAAGERVLILQGDRRLFAISFLACLYAGAIAVPAPPAGGRIQDDERIAGIVKDTAAALILSDRIHAPEVSQLLARIGHGGIPCLAADAVPENAGWRDTAQDPDAVAFLQYTSGSTRDPRGVMVSQRNILACQEAISRSLGTRHGAWLGGWLPFHHDMGLLGQLLHPLWLGGTGVQLSPTAFVKRPVRWLEAISRFGVTVSGAPDFAYDLCVRRVTDEQLAGVDLSGWEVAVNGGEPVRAETMRAFADRFAGTGLQPRALTAAYGLAEATLIVSGSARERTGPRYRAASAAGLDENELRTADGAGETVRTLVCCGPPAGCELRVVDPETHRVLPEGEVGEIWVRGDIVTLGYWGQPGLTAETYRNGLDEGSPEDFLRTGDLGVLENGRLYVTGRIKDMIVIAGRNLYPQDLEGAVQRVSALFGPATAFAVAAEKERIVVVQELRARSHYDVDMDALAAEVESCLAQEFEVQTSGVLLVRPGTVRRTTSGKVQRAAMRGLFLRGELKTLHRRMAPELERVLGAGGRS